MQFHFHANQFISLRMVSHLHSLWNRDKGTRKWPIECRKTKIKVITLANHRGHKQSSEPIKSRSNVADAKRGKMSASESRLSTLQFLIGWESGASFFNQSWNRNTNANCFRLSSSKPLWSKAMSFVTHVLNCHLSVFSRYSSRQAAIIYNIFHIRTNHVAGKKPTTIVKTIS